MLYIFIGFILLFSKCIAMAPDPQQNRHMKLNDLSLVKNDLAAKFRDFEDYLNDSIDYWESLKKSFNPNIPQNIKNFEANLKKLSPHEQELFKKNMHELLNDSELRSIHKNLIRSMGMEVMVSHFQKKIDQKNTSLTYYNLLLNALNSSEDINTVFLSHLSQHALYFESRYLTITTDPAPVFSAFADNYKEYEKQKIQGEITNHELSLYFLKALYPFVKNSDIIQKFLTYCPILSESLNNPSLSIDLDAFCLDAIILKFHNVIKASSNPEEKLSFAPEDLLFIQRTKLPILNLSDIKAIKDPNFKMEHNLWDKQYQQKIEKFAPKIKPLVKEEIKESKAINLPLKKDTPVELPKQTSTNNSTVNMLNDKKGVHQVDKKEDPAEKEKVEIIMPSAMRPEMEMKEKERKTKEIEISPKDLGAAQETASPILPATNQHDVLKEPITPQPIEDKKEEAPKKTRAERKEEKKQQKALSHNLVTINKDIVEPTSLQHTMLTEHDIFTLSTQHYNTIYDLLRNNLTPTTRYEDIISALESLGIKVKKQGNGDYRKLLLPNERKIFIYRPAVPQVGKLFLKKLREELFEKWGLMIRNLRK